MTSTAPWCIRTANGSDLNFIYSTWLNNYRSDSRIGRSVRKGIFFSEYYSVIDKILGKNSTHVLIAHPPNEPNVITAFMVYEDSIDDTPFVLHYAFTKEVFRNLGIAKSLFLKAKSGEGATVFTHHTRTIDSLLEKYCDFIYNPFLIFSKTEGESHGETTYAGATTPGKCPEKRS